VNRTLTPARPWPASGSRRGGQGQAAPATGSSSGPAAASNRSTTAARSRPKGRRSPASNGSLASWPRCECPTCALSLARRRRRRRRSARRLRRGSESRRRRRADAEHAPFGVRPHLQGPAGASLPTHQRADRRRRRRSRRRPAQGWLQAGDLATGMMWSNSSRSREPQSTQRPSSSRQTSWRTFSEIASRRRLLLSLLPAAVDEAALTLNFTQLSSEVLMSSTSCSEIWLAMS
jgi:hypothetical protein